MCSRSRQILSAAGRYTRVLPLDYGPDVPKRLIEALERYGRASGLSLVEIERLGQDPKAAAGFVAAARRGEGRAHLLKVDMEALARVLETRHRYPDRLAVRMPATVWF